MERPLTTFIKRLHLFKLEEAILLQAKRGYHSVRHGEVPLLQAKRQSYCRQSDLSLCRQKGLLHCRQREIAPLQAKRHYHSAGTEKLYYAMLKMMISGSHKM
jgi:hypothetical protein